MYTGKRVLLALGISLDTFESFTVISVPLPKIIRGRRRGQETVFGDGGQV